MNRWFGVVPFVAIVAVGLAGGWLVRFANQQDAIAADRQRALEAHRFLPAELEFHGLPYGACWARPQQTAKPEGWDRSYTEGQWCFAIYGDDGRYRLFESGLFPSSCTPPSRRSEVRIDSSGHPVLYGDKDIKAATAKDAKVVMGGGP